MKKDIAIILGMAFAMQSASNKKTKTDILDSREFNKPEKKNTYTEFVPNSQNAEYRKKFLGVKSKRFKN